MPVRRSPYRLVAIQALCVRGFGWDFPSDSVYVYVFSVVLFSRMLDNQRFILRFESTVTPPSLPAGLSVCVIIWWQTGPRLIDWPANWFTRSFENWVVPSSAVFLLRQGIGLRGTAVMEPLAVVVIVGNCGEAKVRPEAGRIVMDKRGPFVHFAWWMDFNYDIIISVICTYYWLVTVRGSLAASLRLVAMPMVSSYGFACWDQSLILVTDGGSLSGVFRTYICGEWEFAGADDTGALYCIIYAELQCG